MNKEINKQLQQLTNYLINELKNGSIEYIDLLAYHRAKQSLINRKYYGDD